MRGGGRRGGTGRGGGRGGGYGRRDSRPGAAASRDDRNRRDRRPSHSPRRRSDYGSHRRTPSPDQPARRRDDREVTRGNRNPTGGDRNRHRRGLMGHSGDRSPPSGRGDSIYNERSRGRREEDYDGNRELPLHERRDDYGGNRELPLHERRDDYGGVRDLPRDGCRDGYEWVPYPQERDWYNHEDHGASGAYNRPPEYMFTDLPSDLNRPSLRSERKESDYLGGAGDFRHGRDSEYFGSPDGRGILKDREVFGDEGGMALRISATESGRTTALYQERRSPRAALSPSLPPPPPPLYTSVPPADAAFLRGGSSMKTSDGFGTGSAPLLHDDNRFKYGDHLCDPYFERTRVPERRHSGDRDALLEEDGGTDVLLYPAMDVPIHMDRDRDRFHSGRGMLGSDLVPSMQLKQIGGSSSALIANERPYRMRPKPNFEPGGMCVMNGHGMQHHDSLGHGRVLDHRFSRRSLEHASDHSDEALVDIARQERSKLALRDEPNGYDRHHDYVTRDSIIDTYVASESLNGNVSHNPRHISSSPQMTDIKNESINHYPRPSCRMAEEEDRYQDMCHDSKHNRRDSNGIHASIGYPPARGGYDCNSCSLGFEPIGTARLPAHEHDFASYEDGYGLSDREVSQMISRKRRFRSPAHDREMDMRQVEDEFAGRGYDDMDGYDSSPRKMPGFYDMFDETEIDPKYDLPSNGNVFSRLSLPHEIRGEWTNVEQDHPHSSTLAYGNSRRRSLAQRISRPIAHSTFGEPSMRGRGRGRGRGGILTKNGTKRMGVTPDHSLGNEFVGANKYPKSSEEDNPNEPEMDPEDAPEGEDPQKDPPEGSEEFTKQVHQAFLKYTKMINDSPAMQKKFREAAKGSLACCVCGSVARKFPDLDALVSHAYETCKVGLKTKHLGFHKALCVLMGWNWRVAPDKTKAHHSIAADEVNAMKEDLILWPPIVVIHNSSFAIKAKDTEFKIVSKEETEGILADIGTPLGKVKVSNVIPVNQYVILVKFQPTISGLQEAMRIHNHFSAKNHGKEEFQRMTDGKGKEAASIDNLEELLYAHIAVAEDLGYLDDTTKKRCVIKSKKEVEASAQALLNVEQ